VPDQKVPKPLRINLIYKILPMGDEHEHAEGERHLQHLLEKSEYVPRLNLEAGAINLEEVAQIVG
jgi:hypothetical protein